MIEIDRTGVCVFVIGEFDNPDIVFRADQLNPWPVVVFDDQRLVGSVQQPASGTRCRIAHNV